MDQVIEMTINRSSKETGCLIGKTENPGPCARWSKINHFLVAFREHQNKIFRKRRNERHIELVEKRILKDESEVQILFQILETWVPNLWKDIISPLLIHSLRNSPWHSTITEAFVEGNLYFL